MPEIPSKERSFLQGPGTGGHLPYGQEMVVKVGDTHSYCRDVNGGCPQGSILGVFLLNATIDDLEDGCQDLGYGAARPIQDHVPSTPVGNRRRPPSPTESPIQAPKRRPRRLDYTQELDIALPPRTQPLDRGQVERHPGRAALIYR